MYHKSELMRPTTRYVLLVAGGIGSVLGVIFSIPAFMQDNITGGIVATLLVVVGLVLIAISFGETDAML